MKNNPSKFFIFWLIVLVCQVAQAENSALYEEHYHLIEENQKLPTTARPVASPLETLKAQFQKLANRWNQATNLTKWVLVQKPLKAPPEKYNRNQHFGSWIVDLREENCLNTRAKVLIRDSESAVEYSEKNPCSVQKGQWTDKTNLKTYEVAREVDVDHFVPLKNAYDTGGWQWTAAVKCMYSNFMGNSIHLVPMSGSENRAKSDKGPEGYMPPEKTYRCEYLRNWLLVKTIWRLALKPGEAQAIKEHMQREHCDPEMFMVSQNFIDQQRKWLRQNLDMCTLKS